MPNEQRFIHASALARKRLVNENPYAANVLTRVLIRMVELPKDKIAITDRENLTVTINRTFVMQTSQVDCITAVIVHELQHLIS